MIIQLIKKMLKNIFLDLVKYGKQLIFQVDIELQFIKRVTLCYNEN